MDSNLYSRNYNHSETCPSPRASHGISVTCLQGVLICSCLATVAFQEGAVWKDVVALEFGIGKRVLKNHTRKQASAVFVLPPSHVNDVSAGERSSRNRFTSALMRTSREQVQLWTRSHALTYHVPVPHIWLGGTELSGWEGKHASPLFF